MRNGFKVPGGPLGNLAAVITIYTALIGQNGFLKDVKFPELFWLLQSSSLINTIGLVIMTCVMTCYLSSVSRAWISFKVFIKSKGRIKISFKEIQGLKIYDTFIGLILYFSISLIIFFQLYQNSSNAFYKFAEELLNLISGLCLFAAYLLLNYAPIYQQLGKRHVRLLILLPVSAIVLIYFSLIETNLISNGLLDNILKLVAGSINFLAMSLLAVKYSSLGSAHQNSFGLSNKIVWVISMPLFFIYCGAQLLYGIFDLWPALNREVLQPFILMICFLGKIGFLLSTELLIRKRIIYQQFNRKALKRS